MSSDVFDYGNLAAFGAERRKCVEFATAAVYVWHYIAACVNHSVNLTGSLVPAVGVIACRAVFVVEVNHRVNYFKTRLFFPLEDCVVFLVGQLEVIKSLFVVGLYFQHRVGRAALLVGGFFTENGIVLTCQSLSQRYTLTERDGAAGLHFDVAVRVYFAFHPGVCNADFGKGQVSRTEAAVVAVGERPVVAEIEQRRKHCKQNDKDNYRCGNHRRFVFGKAVERVAEVTYRFGVKLYIVIYIAFYKRKFFRRYGRISVKLFVVNHLIFPPYEYADR